MCILSLFYNLTGWIFARNSDCAIVAMHARDNILIQIHSCYALCLFSIAEASIKIHLRQQTYVIVIRSV